MVVWGGLINRWEKKRSERQKRKGKVHPFECRVPKNSKERQGRLPQWSMQRNRNTIEWERLEIFSRKWEIPIEYFMQRWAQKIDRNGSYLTEAEHIKKGWQEYTEELCKKYLHNPDNHDGVITHLEPDILECEIMWALGSITTKKLVEGWNSSWIISNSKIWCH